MANGQREPSDAELCDLSDEELVGAAVQECLDLQRLGSVIGQRHKQGMLSFLASRSIYGQDADHLVEEVIGEFLAAVSAAGAR